MTTNAQDENWSDWVPVSGPDDMPTDEDMFGQWKGDDGFVSSETKLCDVGYSASFRTVVAYRYKIKEPVKCLDNAWDEPTPEEEEAWQAKEREQNKSEGMKYDTDKPAMDLIPPYMEEEIGMVLAFGAQKYAPDNWRKVSPLRSRYLAAAQRHINALKKGEQMDPESGLHHAAHAVCCLMFLGEVELEPSE